MYKDTSVSIMADQLLVHAAHTHTHDTAYKGIPLQTIVCVHTFALQTANLQLPTAVKDASGSQTMEIQRRTLEHMYRT